MCRKATVCRFAFTVGLAIALAPYAHPQTAPQLPESGWHRVGNSAIEMSLPSLATGAVERVWYSGDGARLFARTHTGQNFVTGDFEKWESARETVPDVPEAPGIKNLPELSAHVRTSLQAERLYAWGHNVYRSDDNGQTWTDLTAYKGVCLLGDGISDVAPSPSNAEEITVASTTGIWRSIDGGLSWIGLNQSLPNLPIRRILALPMGVRGARISLDSLNPVELEWAPGERNAWRAAENIEIGRDLSLRAGLTQTLKVSVTAATGSSEAIYAGTADGRLYATSDRGNTWSQFVAADGGPVEALYVDPKDTRIALAALGAHAGAAAAKSPRVMRTVNGGAFWDDITANLPDAAAHGITADPASGAIYAATDAGVFFATADLTNAGRPVNWSSLSGGLPQAPAMDVKLDAGANQLYAALQGYGLYSILAPHRQADVRVVSAADYATRAAAPGSVFSVLGTRVQSAQIESGAAPVLASSDTASQIQIPFEAQGSTVHVALDSAVGVLTYNVPLQTTAPGIFVDPDGAPLVLDSDSGVLLDASRPARASARVQVLATGLGRVQPEWPSGTAAPAQDPPRVVASVHAYINHVPVAVTRAELAPGYVGFYLIEFEVPKIVNAGPGEMYIEADGQQSNVVRLYIAQ